MGFGMGVGEARWRECVIQMKDRFSGGVSSLVGSRICKEAAVECIRKTTFVARKLQDHGR